jgi:hypothetical protein
VDRGGPFGLLGYDCRRLKLERVRQGFFSGPILDPCSQEPHQTTYRTSQNSTSTYASTYRSVKHSFNSCLPQDVVLKYTQYCTSMAVDRRFCTVSKRQGARTGPLPLSRGIKFSRLHRSLILLLLPFPTTPKSPPSRRSMLALHAHSALLPRFHPFPPGSPNQPRRS